MPGKSEQGKDGMMRNRKGVQRVVSVVASLALATSGIAVCLAPATAWAEDEVETLSVETEKDAANTLAADVTTSGSEADSEGTQSENETALETEADAATTYLVWFRLGDSYGGLSDFSADVDLSQGKTLSDLIAEEKADGLPYEAGYIEMFGDASLHRFVGWESTVPLDEPLEASDFAPTTDNNYYSLEIHAIWEDVDAVDPWMPNSDRLLPHTIENGVLKFPLNPELGEWYQLTVNKADGMALDVPGGSAPWTMTIDACYLDPDDPFYNPEPNSGVYFLRGDRGGDYYTSLWVSYPTDKALSYQLNGTGTILRTGGPQVLSIQLDSPATLNLTLSGETVITNAQGATLTHTVSGAVDAEGMGEDGLWSMLSLVTTWLGEDAAAAAGDAVNTAIQGVTTMYVYDIHLEDPNGAEFAIPAGDQVTVTLPIPEKLSAENLHVFHVADDGTVTDMNATVDAAAGTVSFTTSHFSTFVLANVAPQQTAATNAGETLTATGDASLIACAGAALSGLAGAGLVAMGFKRRR